MTASPVVIRPVCPDDAPALLHLAALLDTMNLPCDSGMLANLITASQASFTRLDQPAPVDTAFLRSTYTLVAHQGPQLLGTASLLSHHGTPEDPHYYLQVVEHTFHSTQLQTEHRRQILRLACDEVPWTELGALIVHPEARGQGVGKLLVAARLLLVAMHRTHFCPRLLAELLPSRRTDGGNAFWDALGAPLTGLTYSRADRLCCTNKEFIAALFPRHEILLDLLPREAQAVIGQVGPDTEPVSRLLQRVGFHYLGTVDPFDGGPHYGALLDEIPPLQCSRCLVCLDLPPTQARSLMLLGNPCVHTFYAAPVEICGHGVRLEEPTARMLDVSAGDTVWTLPLDW